MHIHILGICGTFMGGLAQLARASGHRVSGCDANVYPPMSDQLAEAGIELIEGFDAAQTGLRPDLYVVGNVVTRGNPLMEAVLERQLPFASGPQWLAEHVLKGRHVLAVAGTHGKTTTTSMLAWVLSHAGLNPGFLVGGVPQDFGRSALTGGGPFVIEADEYDTAFFDKRSKFVHYLPRTAILNNLEFDHADIFPDLGAIETQFHHFVRTLARSARLVVNADEPALARVLARGCWSEHVSFGDSGAWRVESEAPYRVLHEGRAVGNLNIELPGRHNRMNALAALVAAEHVGVSPAVALDALSRFRGVKRRLEERGTVGGVTVIDDFAHHPTAIRETIGALRARTATGRILAVLEPRSNTMKLGAMKAALPGSLAGAELVYCYAGGVGWDVDQALAPLGARASVFQDLSALADAVVAESRPGDRLLVMSNGGFGGIHGMLLDRLDERARRAA